MIIDQQLLDSLTLHAKQNPRLRLSYDLRTASTTKVSVCLTPWSQELYCLYIDTERRAK